MEAEIKETEQETRMQTQLTSRCSEELIKVKKAKAAVIRDKTIQAAYTADEDIEEFQRQLKIWSKQDTENTENTENTESDDG